MRIAILTSARSGSTSLFHLIEETLSDKNYTCVSEPFNDYWRKPAGLRTYDVGFFENKKNVFIKTFVSKLQRPQKYIDDDAAYWNWFFNYFDKVVILDRKDKDLQSESLTYHMNKKDISSWQKKQHYDLSKISEEDIQESKRVLIEESEKMLNFSKMRYPLFYFEDLYVAKDQTMALKLFNYLELDLKSDLYEKYINSDLFKIRLDPNDQRFKSLI